MIIESHYILKVLILLQTNSISNVSALTTALASMSGAMGTESLFRKLSTSGSSLVVWSLSAKM